MSCRFVVLLVCLFRYRYPNLPIPLHLTGSDTCNIFFLKVGGMVGMERAYDFHKLIRRANTLNHLAAVEYGTNGLQFGRQHNKQSNIWADLHPLGAGESAADLGDYSLLSTDELVTDALKEGLKEALSMLRSLNMALSMLRSLNMALSMLRSLNMALSMLRSLNMALSMLARDKKWFTEP
jgi:hypothetical protein